LKKALQVAYPKSGAIGVYVTIVTPDLIIPDKTKKQNQTEMKKEDTSNPKPRDQTKINSEVLKQDKYQMSVEEVPLNENKEEIKSKQQNKSNK
ncbi:MAG: hypothetical protein N3E37_04710, partial [Candidatus Micrarchaeota archaeon]|nr:hypothetical protein [Candidatus Micrarchaeota archaeon]